MRERTTLRLDADLVAAAASVLGTTTMVETVHAALTEVVRSRRRARIVDFQPLLGLDDLNAMRAQSPGRVAGPHGSKPV